MALLLGIVAAAARTLTNNDDNNRQNNRNNGYGNGYSNNNGQSYDSQNSGYGNNYNGGYPNGYNNGYNSSYGGNNAYGASPYAAYPPQVMISRRGDRWMNRQTRKAERRARHVDMVSSLMNSGSRAGPRSPLLPPCADMQPQPLSGSVPYMQCGDNSRSQSMYSRAPPQGAMTPEPMRSQWQDIQSRDRPASRGDLHPESSLEGLPTYEQAVRKPGRS